MTPFKGRRLDKSQPIEIYRNLHLPGRSYSVRQAGKVIGHTTAIMVKDAVFVVQRAGWERYRKTGIRNVHAFVRGVFTDSGMGTIAIESDLPRIDYDKKAGEFVWPGGRKVTGAMVASLNKNGLGAAYTY